MKESISRLLNEAYRRCGLDTVIFADQLMYMGFRRATMSGASIGVNDFEIPAEGRDRTEADKVKEIERQFADGLVTRAKNTTRLSTSGLVPTNCWPEDDG
ncbi:hypothetical protein [Marinobacterium stanieri]|uniref:hypothetical protein n=1 Tax=Marinobacterium stanieri TaxID=49186 RepID=UPI003A8E97D4